MKDNKTHSVYSASGSERWLNCPGSLREIKRSPVPPDSAAGIEGTNAALLLETWLKHLNSKLGAFIFPKGYDDETKENVGKAVRIVRDVCRKEKIPLTNIRSERKVHLTHIHEDMSGTLDIEIFEDFGTLRIYDYKNGRKKVKVYNTDYGYGHNTQLIYYALAAAHEYRYDFLDCEIGIIQPRVSDKLMAVKLSMKTLRAYEDFFKRGVERTLDKNARLQTGEWCFFCPANPRVGGKCPKLKDAARERNLKNAQMEFDDL